MTLILLGPDGQDIHREECACAAGKTPCCSGPECEGFGCDGSGLVRVPGCGCAKCEAERARDGAEVRP